MSLRSAVVRARAFNRRLRYYLAFATFAGVVLHEFAHWLACKLYGVPVYEVVLFDPAIPGGYVRHGARASFAPTFWICVAPWVVNTAVGAGIVAVLALTWPAGDPTAVEPTVVAASALAGWVAVSALYQAFPSRQDASALWEHTRWLARTRFRYLLVVPVVAPFVVLLYLVDAGRRFWADGLYAVGVVLLVAYAVEHPGLVGEVLADFAARTREGFDARS